MTNVSLNTIDECSIALQQHLQKLQAKKRNAQWFPWGITVISVAGAIFADLKTLNLAIVAGLSVIIAAVVRKYFTNQLSVQINDARACLNITKISKSEWNKELKTFLEEYHITKAEQIMRIWEAFRLVPEDVDPSIPSPSKPVMSPDKNESADFTKQQAIRNQLNSDLVKMGATRKS